MWSILYHNSNKENHIIQANSFIKIVLTRSFIMTKSMMENESKIFANISTFSLRSLL